MDLNKTRRIDRHAPLPFYAQLKAIISDAIADQNLHPGELLPGDNELATHFDLSRSVVRQALAELEAEGVISRRRGKGTFLAEPKVSEGLAGWTGGLADDATSRGSRVTSTVIQSTFAPPDQRVATMLELDQDQEVFVIERVRCLDGEPWVYTIAWLPADVVPGIDRYDFTTESLYNILRNEYGLRFGKAARSIEAALAGPTTGAYLGIAPEDPVLRLTSILKDTSGHPIEAFLAFHRGDRSRFDVELDATVEQLGFPIAVHNTPVTL